MDLPSQVVLRADVEDIWVRDFGLVNSTHPVLMKYAPTYLKKHEGNRIQHSLVKFMKALKLKYDTVDYIGDGGNVVDNGRDCAILSTRWMKDNGISGVESARSQICSALGFKRVALIPSDDEVLGHADGQAAFLA